MAVEAILSVRIGALITKLTDTVRPPCPPLIWNGRANAPSANARATSQFSCCLLLSLLSLVTTAIGVAVALWVRENARAIAAGIGFSTGIMLLISSLELAPRLPADPLSIDPSILLGVGDQGWTPMIDSVA